MRRRQLPCLDCEPGDDPNNPGDNDESEDNRLEGFYIVKPQNGELTKELIPYSNRTFCSFDISTTASFFEDAVALLYTHPYAPNEVVKNQDCLEKRNWDVEKRGGYPIYRPAGPSDQDYKVSKSVSLPLYTLDIENIYITSETDTTAAQAENISRCGF